MQIAKWIKTGTMIFVMCMALALPAEAQDQVPAEVRNDLIDLLQQISEQTPVRADLERLGFSGQKLDLAVRQSRVFMRDRHIAGFVADQLIAANAGQVPAQIGNRGFIGPLIMRGMGHLSTSDMRRFYAIEQLIMRSFPERDCGLAVKERLRHQRWFELSSRIEAQLSLATLKEYYRIQLKAAKLGATRDPVRLDDAQMAATAARINSANEANLAGRADGRQIIAAMNNLNRASNRRACQASILFMETVLGLEGRDLRDALLMLSQ